MSTQSPTGEPPEALSPSRYIEKISLPDRRVLDEPIRPEQLLVHRHRDHHVVDIHARYMMSRVVRKTGSEEEALRRLHRMRGIGHRISGTVARLLGKEDPEPVSRALFGLKQREYFFRFRRHALPREEIARRTRELKNEAAGRLAASGGIRLLLTGGTGFVGKEILSRAVADDAVREIVVLARPKRDRARGRMLSPAERGAALLDELWIDDPERRAKVRFVAGDVEAPSLGIDPDELEELRQRLTHVVHCAASVSFEDPYDRSFRANVLGTLNALRFSHSLQATEGSPFVAHVAIETSYIHGRQVRHLARENEIVFPRNFYNNYYELTKAMASIETERFMLDKGLRLTQLCPAIVIGEARTGNNRGDTKVVNAPVNLFGRAREALAETQGRWLERSKAAVLARLAFVFPGHPRAELNLIPVDRVAEGIVAALKRPGAVGERIHLATDKRITSQQIRDIVGEELSVKITLAEPTLHRTIGLPLATGLLRRLRQDRFASVLERLGSVFGGYSEWGQPVHEVGNDVRVLGLSEDRPDTVEAFRMLCRHNRYVQRFGRIRDAAELSRREKLWRDFVHDVERETGRRAGALSAAEFREALAARPDVRKALADRSG